MAEEIDKQAKTEVATPRRRQEAREQGQVALSTELLSALALCAGFAALVLGGEALAGAAGGLLASSLANLAARATADVSVAESVGIVAGSVAPMAMPVVALIVPLFLVVAAVGYGQVGFQVTPKAIAWDLARLNPIKGLSRIASLRSLVRSSLALAKILVITGTMAAIAWSEVPTISRIAGSELGPMLAGLGHVALNCSIGALIAIVAIAVLDFGYQRWQHESELKMSRKEIKEELRTTEGDPQLKARIRQIQREMARRRMMAEVPKATVVVTNPTHYAVALRYERQSEVEGRRPRAPYVVAKGADHVARKIREIAREAHVPCHEDVALARALHAQVEIGDEIPESLYQAVASVLAYVYRLQEQEVTA